jgi:hypothetical protein
MLELYGKRPAEAILGRTVTLTLGGTVYVLPVLTIAANRKWKADLDSSTASLVEGLTDAGDDIAPLLAALATQTDSLIDLLYSYDTSAVLPERDELEAVAYEDELLAAVQEVWRAANPLVVMALAAAVQTTIPSSDSSAPTSTSPPSTDGPPAKSKRKSPTSNSSRTSTRRKSGATGELGSPSSPA